MDSQRPFLYITLIFLGFMLWISWKQYNAPPPPSTPASETADVSGQMTPPSVPAGNANGVVTPGQGVANLGGTLSANEQLIRIRTDVLDLQISNIGGDIIVADLPTYPVSLKTPDQPMRILDRLSRNYVAQSGLIHQDVVGKVATELAPGHQATFAFEASDYVLAEGQDELIVPLRWRSPHGVEVVKTYRFKRGQFAVTVERKVTNNSEIPWVGYEYRQLQHGPALTNRNLLTSGVQAFEGGAYYSDSKYERVKFDEMKNALQENTVGGWISVLEHYFISAWVPPQEEKGLYFTTQTVANGRTAYVLGMSGTWRQIPPGSSDAFNSTFWVGPKLQDDLEAIAKGLDLTVDYGIFAFVSKPIFWVMQWIHSVVQNWGWTIIFLTLLIKLLFFWPSAMSYKSMAKMKAAAPKLKEISDRYSNDAQAKQKAMMDLYKKEKINPLGGCLPILIQIPVFMGLYWVLMESVELRQASWILWYNDLSIRDPYFVLPLIMGATMYLQQKLNPPPTDPMQQKIFQFLPVVFTVMFLFFPAGLVLYWVVNNILSIAQQWFINKKIVGHA